MLTNCCAIIFFAKKIDKTNKNFTLNFIPLFYQLQKISSKISKLKVKVILIRGHFQN